MRPYAEYHPLWLMVTLVSLTALWVCCVLSWVAAGMSVPGTRQRYVWTTVAWTLVPFGWVDAILLHLLQAPPWLSVPFVWMVCYVTWDLWKRDDDNWWRRTRKALLGRLRAVQGRWRPLQPSPSPS